jgi:predicted Rossmann fold flavoprotein
MQGLSLKNVTLRIFNGKRKAWDGFGEMMFTHFGVTGPLVLTASADLADCLRKGQLKAEIDLKPALTEEKLDERILRAFEQNPNKEIRNVAPEIYPQKMVPVLLRRCRIDSQKAVNSITKAERARLVCETKHFTFTITHPGSFREAVVTHGGIRVREVDPGTMESRKTAGLFFAGEVLDVDAHTGGYNLQIAWSTGRAAGLGAAAYAKSQSEEAE